MADTVSSLLNTWSSFYIMTGSSAAALTGLMFVVLTLVAGTERARGSQDGTATFSTPTVLHFCAALFVSAVLAAPWSSLLSVSILLGIGGFYGVVYMANIMYRTTRLKIYVADREDWFWYVILPFIAYVALFAGSIAFLSKPVHALFALASSVLLLIFIGIHNAWDIVTFIATGQLDKLPDEPQR